MRLFDAHCHLQDKRYDEDREATIARMKEAGVGGIVVGTDAPMSAGAISLAEAHDFLWATVGVHPTDNHTEIFDIEKYTTFAEHPKVVAIGECGIDYYRFFDEEERQRQINLFEQQIILAQKVGKPLMIHGRPSKGSMDAYHDILVLLRAHPGVQGNIHFFVGDVDTAKQFLDLGFSFSFTGVLTFTNDYDAVVQYIPLENLLTETDSPYVAPVPYRGKRNEPIYVNEVVEKVAQLKGLLPEDVAAQVLTNAQKLFKLSV